MSLGNYQFHSDLAIKHQATGREQGRVLGRARAIVDLLAARVPGPSDEDRARILACTDALELSSWLHKAATAEARRADAPATAAPALGPRSIWDPFATACRTYGYAQGQIEGGAGALVDYLGARGLGLTPEARARILTCTDGGALAAWLYRAPTAKSTEQVFGDPDGHARPPHLVLAQAILDVLEARRVTVGRETWTRLLACTDCKQLTAWLRRAANATNVDDLL